VRYLAEMGRRLNSSMTQQFTMRSKDEVTGFFDGLSLVEPGVVLTHEWRPDTPRDAKTPRRPVGRRSLQAPVTRPASNALPPTQVGMRDSRALRR
jgi:hypothetical protein